MFPENTISKTCWSTYHLGFPNHHPIFNCTEFKFVESVYNRIVITVRPCISLVSSFAHTVVFGSLNSVYYIQESPLTNIEHIRGGPAKMLR